MDKSPPYTHKKYNKNFQRPEVEELTEKTKQSERFYEFLRLSPTFAVFLGICTDPLALAFAFFCEYTSQKRLLSVRRCISTPSGL